MRKWFIDNRPIILFLAFLVIIAYGNTLDNAFVADDVAGIANNPQITKSSYLLATPMMLFKNILYFTLVKLFGRSPTPFHALNIFFHLGNVWLIFFLVQKIIKDKRTALFAAALTAVHPILTEGVTWISGGQYSRYTFFLLLSLALYIQAKDLPTDRRPMGLRLQIFSIISFILALLTSEKAIVLPLIIATYELSFGSIRNAWKRLTPFFALSGVWGVILLGRIGQRIADVQTTYYQSPQTYNPFVQIPVAITEYLKLIVWPDGLTLYHSEMGFSQTEYFLRLLVFLTFLAIIAYGYFKKRQIFFWGTLFLVSLLPTLTPLGISWIVAERYVYMGAVGIFALLAMVLEKLMKITKNDEAVYAVLTLIILLLTARTVARNNDWQNQDSLWLASARTSPSSPQNHNNLGDLYGRRGDLERSAEEFKIAIELNPNYADAYHNLGNTYQQMGKINEAVAAYQKAAELNPRLWQSYQNMAAIYFERGEFEKAKKWMEKAVEANPENLNLQNNLEIINAKIFNPQLEPGAP